MQKQVTTNFLKATLGFLVIVFTLNSCDQKPSKEAQEFNSLIKEVLDVHDDVMPKMGEMGKLSGELKAKADTTEAGKIYQKALDSLGNAHDAMMKWMENFNTKFPYAKDRLKGKSTEDILNDIEALKDEQKQVNRVRDAVNGSIKNAKNVLAQ